MSGRSAVPIPAPEDKRKRAKSHVFLIAVKQRREGLRVYAVRASSQDDALAIVAASSSEGAAVEAAGRLSKKLARPLKLQPEVPRPV
ncbi:hypothetical protein ACLBWX_04395 [Methylobacterium sp. M6A4_1b]